MTEANWISKTIAPKSDQLNAEDLLTGPKTFTIRSVRETGDKQQPAAIDIDGHQPYKPCKTCRRLLIACWGDETDEWIGRRITLYCDPTVKYGKDEVGGIRVSHVSHIDAPKVLKLSVTRGKRAAFKVLPLPTEEPEKTVEERAAAAVAAYETCTTEKRLSVLDTKIDALYAACTDEQKQLVQAARDAAVERVNG